MGALLTTADSALLTLASCPAKRQVAARPDDPNVGLMTKAATACSVPVFRVRYSPDQDPAADKPTVAYAAQHKIYPLNTATEDWAATALGVDVAAVNRTTLIVIGHWLEEAVTFLVLRALSHSYKVYVAFDGIASETTNAGETARQRLLYAGAIPTTVHQVVREWAATTSERNRRQTLLDLSAE